MLLRKLYNWLHHRKYIYSPYPIEIYRDLLIYIKNRKDISIKVLAKESFEIDKINIFLRHDVDFASDMRKLNLLIDIENSLNMKSAIYIRMDKQEYNPDEYKDYILSLYNLGFEVGLHTTCYLNDDYLKVFKQETQEFIDIFGFNPKSFTVHGMGQYRLDVRQRFVKEIEYKMQKLGYIFTDAILDYIIYDHVIHDCHLDPEKKKRFILKDFKRSPFFFKKGKTYLILTHPGYWRRS